MNTLLCTEYLKFKSANYSTLHPPGLRLSYVLKVNTKSLVSRLPYLKVHLIFVEIDKLDKVSLWLVWAALPENTDVR